MGRAGAAAGLATGLVDVGGAIGVFAAAEVAGWALASRDFFRNGLVCLATLSHNARSSSLSVRLRWGGGSGGSGIDDGTRRFIGDDNDA